MTNKQILVLRQIKKVLKDAGMRTGEYPFDVEKFGMGDWNNVALIQDGDEYRIEDPPNKQILKSYNVHVWLYSNIEKQRIKNVLDIQATIEDSILDDLSLDDNAWCVDIESVEKGTYLNEFDGYEVGYSGHKSCRKLNFVVTINQTR